VWSTVRTPVSSFFFSSLFSLVFPFLPTRILCHRIDQSNNCEVLVSFAFDWLVRLQLRIQVKASQQQYINCHFTNIIRNVSLRPGVSYPRNNVPIHSKQKEKQNHQQITRTRWKREPHRSWKLVTPVKKADCNILALKVMHGKGCKGYKKSHGEDKASPSDWFQYIKNCRYIINQAVRWWEAKGLGTMTALVLALMAAITKWWLQWPYSETSAREGIIGEMMVVAEALAVRGAWRLCFCCALLTSWTSRVFRQKRTDRKSWHENTRQCKGKLRI
jgi:hypothetical protein